MTLFDLSNAKSGTLVGTGTILDNYPLLPVLEDTSYSFAVADFAGHFLDVTGKALTTVTITQLPTHGSLALAGQSVVTGRTLDATELTSLTYQGYQDYCGADYFLWEGVGATGNELSSAFTIKVLAVNDAPSFTAGPDQTASEGGWSQAVTGWATEISAGPANESPQTLNFVVTNDNNALFSVQPFVTANGTLTYTAAASATGIATVSVQLFDVGGIANGGTNASSAQTFVIEVTTGPIVGDDMATVFTLTVGDSSGSQSERWALHVGPVTHTSPDYGQVSSADYAFTAGESYDITLEHLGTRPAFLATSPDWGYPKGAKGPNYDWTASITEVGSTLPYWIDDPYSTAPVVGPLGGDQYKLLQTHIWDVIGDPNLTAGKVAHLHIPQLDVDVDSKNDDGFVAPTDNAEEDQLERNPLTGKAIYPSTGDLDADGIIDSEDFDGITDGHFVPMVLRFSENIEEALPSQLTVSFAYDSSVLRIWMPGKDASVARTSGDIIASDSDVDASSWGRSPGGEVVVFVEALEASATVLPITVSAHVVGTIWSGTLTDTVHVVAAQSNVAPVLAPITDQTLSWGHTLTVVASATDANVPANALMYSLGSGPSGMTIDPTTGKLTWTPNETQGPGTYPVQVRVADNGVPLQSDTTDFQVTVVVNDAPRFTSTPVVDAYVGITYSYESTASDPEDEPLMFALPLARIAWPNGFAPSSQQQFSFTEQDTLIPGGGDERGIITWNPPAVLAGKTVTIYEEVSDVAGNTVSRPIQIFVHPSLGNHDPIIVSTPLENVLRADYAAPFPRPRVSDDLDVGPG